MKNRQFEKNRIVLQMQAISNLDRRWSIDLHSIPHVLNSITLVWLAFWPCAFVVLPECLFIICSLNFASHLLMAYAIRFPINLKVMSCTRLCICLQVCLWVRLCVFGIIFFWNQFEIYFLFLTLERNMSWLWIGFDIALALEFAFCFWGWFDQLLEADSVLIILAFLVSLIWPWYRY